MAESFSAGRLVGGRYRIDREIGRGGMATVYRAWDDTNRRDVAVKVLSPNVMGSLGADRFVAEIHTTAGLAHPHILTLLDSGREGDAPFYVMPLVRGESLRDRLVREGSLSLDEALRIGAAIANALAHAHSEGVIHRDVKPANILLDQGGNPYLADFGIARAISVAGDASLTTTGQILGTLQYMSPEQIDAQGRIDGTTDLYALACVVFEMLAGRPPFTGSSPRALMAAHLFDTPPLLRDLRADTPQGLDDLVQRALSKRAADRIQTASEFAKHLEEIRAQVKLGPSIGPPRRFPDRKTRRPFRTSLKTYGASAALFVTSIVMIANVTAKWGRPPILDRTRYAILPFARDASLPNYGAIETLFADAFDRWDSITVVDRQRIAELTATARGRGSLSLDEAGEVARAAQAGRLVTGEVSTAGDSVRVEIAVREQTSPREPAARVTFFLGPEGQDLGPKVAAAADALLFGSFEGGLGSNAAGTTSMAARREYGLGQSALAEWDLAAAEGHFESATRSDPRFDLAVLWKAQVQSWQGRPNDEWSSDAMRARDARDRLPALERRLAVALGAMAEGRFPDACTEYIRLLESSASDFLAWYGSGECRRRDELVLPDAGSRTGWSFRSSGHAAVEAYRRAFELLPTTYRTLGAANFELAQRFLYARREIVRGGFDVSANRRFDGIRELRGDTLAFVAVPEEMSASFVHDFDAEAGALQRQRAMLLRVANTWVTAYPRSSGALSNLAAARELIGDPEALATYRAARDSADDTRLRAQLAVAETILWVRRSLPHDLVGLRGAVALGDSVLTTVSSGPNGDLARLPELAVLLGRPALAARMSRANTSGDALAVLPTEIVRVSQALLAFAVVGAPRDSIQALEAETDRLIRDWARPYSAQRMVIARQRTLEQAAYLAFPNDTLDFLSLSWVAGGSNRAATHTQAIAALQAGDTQGALRLLGDPFTTAGWDVVFARANALAAAGEPSTALALLKSRFDMLAVADPAEVASMARLGALARAVVLRAELEDAWGSRTEAEVWARAAETLWGSGDEAVMPTVTRMRDLTGSQDGR